MKTPEELKELASEIHTSLEYGSNAEDSFTYVVGLLQELQEEAVQPYKDLGTVYIPPEDWDYGGMGGPPDIGEYQKIDLATFVS